MVKAIYPGSFDPITLGHLDVIERAAKLSDELIVGVLNNGAKTKAMFSPEERVKIIKEATAHIPNIQVKAFGGLLVEFAQQEQANIIVRGLRAITDFEYELQMSQTNHILNKNVDTVFFTTSLEYSYLSSSTVKEVAWNGGNVEKFVPACVVPYIYERCRTKNFIKS